MYKYNFYISIFHTFTYLYAQATIIVLNLPIIFPFTRIYKQTLFCVYLIFIH